MEKLYYTYKEYSDLEKRTYRRSREYEQWKYYIKKRDHFCCVKCGSKKALNVHHLEGYRDNIEKRIRLKNGITLCRECHSKIHPWMNGEVEEVRKSTVILRKASADALMRLGTDPVPPRGTKQPPSLI